MLRNASINRISSKQNDGATYRIYLNYFYGKVLMETILQKAENFKEKTHQNLSINCISSKQNYGKYLSKLHTVLVTHTEWLQRSSCQSSIQLLTVIDCISDRKLSLLCHSNIVCYRL